MFSLVVANAFRTECEGCVYNSQDNDPMMQLPKSTTALAGIVRNFQNFSEFNRRDMSRKWTCLGFYQLEVRFALNRLKEEINLRGMEPVWFLDTCRARLYVHVPYREGHVTWRAFPTTQFQEMWQEMTQVLLYGTRYPTLQALCKCIH